MRRSRPGCRYTCGYVTTHRLNFLQVLFLLLLVGVAFSIPLSSPPQTPFPKNDDKESIYPLNGKDNSQQHISASASHSETLPTSTYLTQPVPGSFENEGQVTEVHISKEVRRMSFNIVEEISGARHQLYPPMVHVHSSSDVNLEPTEVEAPGTTPTTVPLMGAIDVRTISHMKSRNNGGNRMPHIPDSVDLDSVPKIEKASLVKIRATKMSHTVDRQNTDDIKYKNVSENTKVYHIRHPASIAKISGLIKHNPLLANRRNIQKTIDKQAKAIRAELPEEIKSTGINIDAMLGDDPEASLPNKESSIQKDGLNIKMKEEMGTLSIRELKNASNSDTEAPPKTLFIEVKKTDGRTSSLAAEDESPTENPEPSNSKEALDKDAAQPGQIEMLDSSSPKHRMITDVQPAEKRDFPDGSSASGSFESYYDMEHPPFAEVIPKNPGLPIEDSEEASFPLKSLPKDVLSIPQKVRILGHDGINESSSEDEQLHPNLSIRTMINDNEEASMKLEVEDVIGNCDRCASGTSLPSSEHIINTARASDSLLIPSILESDSPEPIIDDYTSDSLLDSPRQERVSVPVSQPIKNVLSPGSVAAIVFGVLLCIGAALGGFAFIMYHRQTDIRPKVLSSDRSCANSDSGGYLDDQCRVAYVNSQMDMMSKGSPEDLVSLDNDSFLNSLESMTIQNLWTDSIRHTKL